MKKLLLFLIVLLTTFPFEAAARGGGGHSSSGGTIHVNSYTRKDGTVVSGYDRAASGGASGSSASSGYSGAAGSGESGTGKVYTWEDKDGFHATNNEHEVPTRHHASEEVKLPSPSPTVSTPVPAASVPALRSYQQQSHRTRTNYNPGGAYRGKNYAAQGGGIKRDSHGRIKRSAAAKHAFQRDQPCPSTGKTSGPCPGYVIDHIVPLKRGGADDPSNMQWQTTADAKAKDKWE